jgi:hypothetical protein
MSQDARQPVVWSMEARDEAATISLANDVATLLRPGDLVTLTGDLGSGKTTFARALIRALVGDPALEAPSPTFTLMQVYEAPDYKIVHADLYRIEKAAELTDLGWEDLVEDALVLVEWPEHAHELFRGDRLDVGFAYDVSDAAARTITLTGYGAAGARLAAFKALRDLLRQTGWADAQRTYLQGDASTRVYEKLTKPDGETAILMNSPSRADGPPIRYGRSYSAIARLAENIKAFVGMSEGLRSQGLSAPKIIGADFSAGFAVVEDLGGEGIVDADGRPIASRYLEAAAVLAYLHSRKLPDMIPVKGAGFHHIPPYDLDALLIEIELIVDWYAARASTRAIASGARATFVNLWRQILIEIANAPVTWVLRDFHSPNLLWLPERDGLARLGLLDFQDCVLGHPAYDLVSLGQDARVDVSDDLELKLLSSYARLRREADPTFDVAGFARAYGILGAQRATKVLGIFARLDRRDQKPQYLAHLPRVERYLQKNLRHPALADIKAWYEANLPDLFRAAA